MIELQINDNDYENMVGYNSRYGEFHLDMNVVVSKLQCTILGYELMEPIGIKVLLDVGGTKWLLVSKTYTVVASFLNHPDNEDYNPDFGLGILHTLKNAECVIAPTEKPVTFHQDYVVYPIGVLKI